MRTEHPSDSFAAILEKHKKVLQRYNDFFQTAFGKSDEAARPINRPIKDVLWELVNTPQKGGE